MTDIERRALLGDKQAQKECTEKGILLPCPCCKNKAEVLFDDSAFDGEPPRRFHYIRCKSCFLKSGLYTSVIAALDKWNNRPALPIGQCEECLKSRDLNRNDSFERQYSEDCVWCMEYNDARFSSDFCNYFEPKEGEEH